MKNQRRKYRTSVELSSDVNEFLEKEAKSHQVPPSEMLRQIIDELSKNFISLKKYKRKLKNITLFSHHIDLLEKLGFDLIPDGWKGKRGVNRGQVAEILIREYWNKKIREKGRAIGALSLQRLEFLKDIMCENDETIIQIAIDDLYQFRFQAYIHQKVLEIDDLYQFRFQAYIHQKVLDLREIDDDIELRIAIKNLLTSLYADKNDLKAVQNDLNYLDVPPHGRSWSMAHVRQAFKDLNIHVS